MTSAIPGGVPTLLAALGASAGIAALTWLLLGLAARMAPGATARFAAGNAVLALGAGLTSQRGADPSYLFYPFADISVLIALALFRVGVQTLLHARVTLVQVAVVVGVAAVVLLAGDPGPGGQWLRVVTFSLAAAVMSLQVYRDSSGALRGEFGPLAARAGGALFALFGALMLLRAAWYLGPGASSAGMPAVSAMQYYVSLWFFMLMLVALNVSLMALLMMRLIVRIQRLAVRDPLTGVLNRRSLEARIAAETLRERRQPGGYALVMFDLDHLKRINERLGNAGGDAALKHATQVLGGTLRGADALGRLGGEKFVVVMSMTDTAGAMLAAERMRAALIAHPLQWKEQKQTLTASFGVCAGIGAAVDDQEMLKRAEAALYLAKTVGPNRVEAGPQLGP